MELEDLMHLIEYANNMGWSVFGQLKDVMDGESLDEQNPNALKEIKYFLSEAKDADVEGASDLYYQIDEYLSNL